MTPNRLEHIARRVTDFAVSETLDHFRSEIGDNHNLVARVVEVAVANALERYNAEFNSQLRLINAAAEARFDIEMLKPPATIVLTGANRDDQHPHA